MKNVRVSENNSSLKTAFNNERYSFFKKLHMRMIVKYFTSFSRLRNMFVTVLYRYFIVNYNFRKFF
jgi:hypothetical protein